MTLEKVERVLAALYPGVHTVVKHEEKVYIHTGEKEYVSRLAYYVEGRKPNGWSEPVNTIHELVAQIVEEFMEVENEKL